MDSLIAAITMKLGIDFINHFILEKSFTVTTMNYIDFIDFVDFIVIMTLINTKAKVAVRFSLVLLQAMIAANRGE